MPKVIQEDKRNEIKIKMLMLLSVNGRTSMDYLSHALKVPKATAYTLFNEVVKEYDLHFVPEISISDVWRYEFIKISKHKSTKREMREEALDKIPELGLEEYLAFFKFIGKVASDDEIMKAMSKSHTPQFAAKLHGGDDIVIYCVGKSFYNVNKFIIDFTKSLEKYNIEVKVSRIVTVFGFFPLRNELLNELMLSDTHKALIEGLNKNARQEIRAIANEYHKKPELLVYAMDRLRRGGLLERITYYEAKPKTNVNGIIQIKIVNESKFTESRTKWFLDMAKSSSNKHNEYIYICDTQNPIGVLVFVNLSTNESIDNLISMLRRDLKGVEITYTTLTKILLGNLGIRNFDMRYSQQYKWLESKNLVPRANIEKDNKIYKEEQSSEDLEENKNSNSSQGID